MPSGCKFLAIVWGKEETKRLKQREMPLGVFKRVPSRCADPTTQLWSGPFSPPLSSSQKKYVKLLTITIVYHWKSSYLLSLSFGFCLLPYFSHCIKILSKLRQVMKLFSSKLPIHSVRFFMYYKSYYFCLRSCKSHSQENEKFMSTTGQFSCTDSLPFKGRNLICTLDLIDLVMQIQQFPRDEHWSLTFPIVNRVKCFLSHP